MRRLWEVSQERLGVRMLGLSDIFNWFRKEPEIIPRPPNWELEKEFRSFCKTGVTDSEQTVFTYLRDLSETVPLTSLLYIYIEEMDPMDRTVLINRFSDLDNDFDRIAFLGKEILQNR